MSEANERMEHLGINKNMTTHEKFKTIHKRKTNHQQKL